MSIHGREPVMEGAAVPFSLSANPAPPAPIQVMVLISNSGNFAAPAERGSRTVGIDPSGTVTFMVETADDHREEPDGSIVARVMVMDDDGADLAPVGKAKRAWYVRFGRAVTHSVVTAVQGRFTAAPSPAGLTLTVAGEDLTTMPLKENEVALAKLLGFQTVATGQLVQDSAFSFSPTPPAAGEEGEGGTPCFSLWGAGALSSFSGQEHTLSLNGDVTTALLGADWRTTHWQAGAALAHSWGSGSYAGQDDNDADGDLTATMTGLFPYGRYALSPRLGIWAVAGYGWGALRSTRWHREEIEKREHRPAATMVMGAVGIDGLLIDGGAQGFSLTTTTDLLSLKTSTEQVDGLAFSTAGVSRLRLGLEATRPFPLPNGASLLPSMEMGIRHDGGDAESGFGLEVGAALAWSAPQQGITAEVKGRSLVTHVDEEFRQQGLALSFAWEANPSNRGPSLSVSHAVGATASGMDALLSPAVLEGLHSSAGNEQRFKAELAYGFPIHNDRLTLTPALSLALSPATSAYGIRWSLSRYSQQGQTQPWQLSLQGEREETTTADTPVDHSLTLSLSLLF
ncbi:MAG: autotransporter domain-containing protein [Cyanobacteria bacterium MAG CAR2_bin_4]|nr:autotransporter domain-containing protein [Cyanobacteria bacterium MAG CAR2_bin_4]